VQLQQAAEFADRRGMIFHAEIDVTVVVPAGAAVGADHKQSGALLTPAIAAGRLPGFQGGEHPFGEFTLAGVTRGTEGVGHGLDDLFTGEQVALDGEIFPDEMSGPRKTLGAGVGRSMATGIDHRHLPRVPVFITGEAVGQRLGGGFSRGHRGETFGTKADPGPGLSGYRADPGLRPRDHAADTEILALHRYPEIAGLRVKRHNGEGIHQRFGVSGNRGQKSQREDEQTGHSLGVADCREPCYILQTMLNFTKMNGAGNDFVMVDNRDLKHEFARDVIARLCDRHRGVGADGLIAVEPAENGADFKMRYYNADGGEAEMCGNGARCFARFASRLSGRKDGIQFETIAGVVGAELLGDNVRLKMSEPKDLAMGAALPVHEEQLTVHFVNTGVPHAIVVSDDVGKIDVRRTGAALRYHEHFAPKGTNANFIEVQGPGLLAIRTYERGVEDETLACGTGVCAAALVHSLLSGAASPVSVRVKGGDTLEVGFERKADGSFTNVTLTGPADFVFDGQVPLTVA